VNTLEVMSKKPRIDAKLQCERAIWKYFLLDMQLHTDTQKMLQGSEPTNRSGAIRQPSFLIISFYVKMSRCGRNKAI